MMPGWSDLRARRFVMVALLSTVLAVTATAMLHVTASADVKPLMPNDCLPQHQGNATAAAAHAAALLTHDGKHDGTGHYDRDDSRGAAHDGDDTCELRGGGGTRRSQNPGSNGAPPPVTTPASSSRPGAFAVQSGAQPPAANGVASPASAPSHAVPPSTQPVITPPIFGVPPIPLLPVVPPAALGLAPLLAPADIAIGVTLVLAVAGAGAALVIGRRSD
jgi:hypothetical protein